MKTLTVDDTIVAIATARGGAARGVVRLSGPDVVYPVDQIFRPNDQHDWKTARHAVAVSGTVVLDRLELDASVYYWPTAASYTGQPSAEIHTLGSPPLLQWVLRQLISHGARLAEPGEFTLRAFLAGRLDLTQAEAVLGVIDATTPSQLQAALTQLAGGLATPLQTLRSQLLDLLADLEAGLDFVEEDISFISADELVARLTAARKTVGEIRKQLDARGDHASEYRVVLVGAPNVGKSSLWNMLVGDGTALVSSESGTTRDYLTARWQVEGWRCLLTDTAGLDENFGTLDTPNVSRLAQETTRHQATTGDVCLFCLDGSRPLTRQEHNWLQSQTDARTLIVLTKSDLPRHCDYTAYYAGPVIETSSVTNTGHSILRRAVREMLERIATLPESALASTNARCEASLLATEKALEAAEQLAQEEMGDELVAGELRVALEALGQVVGAVYTDDVLDRVFSRFCIGK